MLSNKARFIEEVCSGNLVVSNRKKVELLNDLQSRGYDLFNKANDRHDNASSDDEDEDSASVSDLSKGYEYLLGMKLWVSKRGWRWRAHDYMIIVSSDLCSHHISYF